MNPVKYFVLSSIFVVLAACGSSNTSASSLFEIQLEGNKREFKQNESVGIALKNKKKKP